MYSLAFSMAVPSLPPPGEYRRWKFGVSYPFSIKFAWVPATPEAL
jgi:hypothetical protein